MNSERASTTLPTSAEFALIAEIDRSLSEIQTSLQSSLPAEADAAATHPLDTLLAETVAALEFIEQDSLAALCRLLCESLLRERTHTSPAATAWITVAGQSLQILRHALAALLHGHISRPADLLPCWSALSSLSPASSAHPSRLLSLRRDMTLSLDFSCLEHDLILLAQQALSEALSPRPEHELAELDQVRTAADACLLDYLRAESDVQRQQTAAALVTILSRIVQCCTDESDKLYWLVMISYVMEIAQTNVLDLSRSKKILAAIIRQVRQVKSISQAESSLCVANSSRSLGLIREILFELAHRPVLSQTAQQVMRVYRLEWQFPRDASLARSVLLSGLTAGSRFETQLELMLSAFETSGAANTCIAAWPALIQALQDEAAYQVLLPAMLHLQSRLEHAPLSEQESLHLAACLLCLRQGLKEGHRLPDESSFLNRIAVLMSDLAIGDASFDGHGLHRLSQSVEASGLLQAITRAMLDSLTSLEHQIETSSKEGTLTALLPACHKQLQQMQAVLQILEADALCAALTELLEFLHPMQTEPIPDEAKQTKSEQSSDARWQQAFAERLVLLEQAFSRLPLSTTLFDHSQPLSVPDATQPACSTALKSIFIQEAGERVQQLRALLSDWAQSPGLALPLEAVHAAHALSGSAATVGLQAMHKIALALESSLESLLHFEHATQYADSLMEAVSMLEKQLGQLTEHSEVEAGTHIIEQLLQLSGALFIQSIDQLESTLDIASEPASEVGIKNNQEAAQAMQSEYATATAAEIIAGIAGIEDTANTAGIVDTADKVIQSTALPVMASMPVSTAMPDEQDELRAIFREELADYLPQLEQALSSWIGLPSASDAPAQMLRILHTLKGSARMAGELALGDAFHRWEDSVSGLSKSAQSTSFDTYQLRQLQSEFDQRLPQLLSVEVSPVVMSVPIDAATQKDYKALTVNDAEHPDLKGTAIALDKANTADNSSAADKSSMGQEKSASLQLRLRADLLERFVSGAAELMVGSSQLGTELHQQRAVITELSENILRLRGQLRELEIASESGIASQSRPGLANEFDPLEFDRYTRLHEITRMMAESLADISSVQRSLAKQHDALGLSVLIQGRHARSLQADLKLARALPFSSLAPRLRYLLRQAARETQREAELLIEDEGLELDRALLDSLSAPLEHLIRNAMAHGIEAPLEREAQGKIRTGQLRIRLSQQSNELLLQLSDDGRGLDYEKIRAQAIDRGLLAADTTADETSLSALIFEPGFSTASQVSELAGRGIGMDAVRTSLHAIGAAIDISSRAGEGCCFTLKVPLSLASLRVMMVTAGERQYALPSSMVQQVLQLSQSDRDQACAEGCLTWQGRQIAFHHLGGLLAEAVPARNPGQRIPVLIVRQLDRYLALELEAIGGQREIIIKNTGPQIAHVSGIAGATLLSDGSIALIIHPFPLLERMLHSAQSGYLDQRMPVRAAHSAQEALKPLILVVDDSLTVRRASQRLLERHAYSVALARDGVDAWEKLQLQLPAAILLDIEMPRMDGFELLGLLREDARFAEVPVIMITSRTADRHRERAAQLGVAAYIGKPYLEDELLALLKNMHAPSRRAA